MAVPLPVDLSVGAAPIGWEGKLPDLFTLIQASLQAQLDPNFLTGRCFGNMPLHDIGPWFDGRGWWFFDPLAGQYTPDQQGMPIGSIAMWGGLGNQIPANWLSCYGQDVSRYTYSFLFGAIGETWGPGDGQSTFTLPPGGVFFVNAAGFSAESVVPLGMLPNAPGQPQIASSPEGVGSRGGGQTNVGLLASDMPGLQVVLKAVVQNFANSSPTNPGTPIANIQKAQASFFTGQVDMPIVDMNNNPTGVNQTDFNIMPPYIGINCMIKYQ